MMATLGTALGAAFTAAGGEGATGAGCWTSEAALAAARLVTDEAARAGARALAMLAAGAGGEVLLLTTVLSMLISGADKPSIIDLPTAPSATATPHTVNSMTLRERTVAGRLIRAATRQARPGTTLAASEESALLHYRGVCCEPHQGRPRAPLHRKGLFAPDAH
ncbi:hypothetical protein [Paraburkholderia sp. DHOC27]|uniref:hypothetical protein n=1 Tax=Paraburkholderia sp. DHOC27 TaxID=2303330 RepID=UPI000E3CC351|nr:hypothetical protein [Paraburkholderia sp. DHOC27]RFU46003.1 hypothetical protein D0B32_20305 [Paraburkholderia sp. DHOC27]